MLAQFRDFASQPSTAKPDPSSPDSQIPSISAARLDAIDSEIAALTQKQEDMATSFRQDVKGIETKVKDQLETLSKLLSELRDTGVPPAHQDYKEIEVNYRPAEPLNGIIALMTNSAHGNVHDKKYMHIYASSVWHDESRWAPKNVADFDKLTGFSSKREARQWLCYDFNLFRVRVDKYTIKSADGGVNWTHLKSWILEGSVDNRVWDELHRCEESAALNGSYKIETFSVWKQINARYVRLRMLGPNHFGTEELAISALELHGVLLEVKKPAPQGEAAPADETPEEDADE
jgi:hypothetical protein